MSDNDSTMHTEITGIVLAGGRNSRMGGHHKALLQWQQRPFIAHIVERLHNQVAQLAINSNQPQLFTEWTLPIIVDPFEEQRGPLAGMLAGLNYSKTPLTLFVPCDNPLISPALSARLYEGLLTSKADIVYAGSQNDNHYLYALIRTSLRDSIREFLESGATAVRQWYAQQRSCRIDFDDCSEDFININCAEDLAQFVNTEAYQSPKNKKPVG